MIKMRVTKLFFDSPAVIRAMDRATRKALSKVGAFVRRSARSSIRKRKKVSRPGQPPSSHVGLLRKFLFFAYEPQRQSVVIGPAKLGGVEGDDVPHILEHGGTTTITRFRRGKIVRKRVKIAARPTMGPALEANLEHIPKQWRGRVRRG